MRVLFTTSDRPLSRLIRRVTGEPVSHCALLFGPWVAHSSLKGVQITSLERFLADGNRVIEGLDLGHSDAEAIHLITKQEGKPYDFGALLYLGLRALLPFLPKANLWNSTGMFLCTELVETALGGPVNPMLTPHQLYLQLKTQQESKENA